MREVITFFRFSFASLKNPMVLSKEKRGGTGDGIGEVTDLVGNGYAEGKWSAESSVAS
jgi:hypothetical protein